METRFSSEMLRALAAAHRHPKRRIPTTFKARTAQALMSRGMVRTDPSGWYVLTEDGWKTASDLVETQPQRPKVTGIHWSSDRHTTTGRLAGIRMFSITRSTVRGQGYVLRTDLPGASGRALEDASHDSIADAKTVAELFAAEWLSNVSAAAGLGAAK